MRRILMLAVMAACSARAGAAETLPGAEKVVVRGARDLAEVLAAATRDAWADPAAARAVAVVVDVTPNTQASAASLRAAIEALGDRVLHLEGTFRIGALGRPLRPERPHPFGLLADLPEVLAGPTPERNTIRALSRTLAGFGARGGVVVYLADWRFEDDDGLEPFIARLRERRQSLRVIGSEAAFDRPWTTPFWPRVRQRPDQNYEEGIGRNPFGSGDPEAPWHGGDTAFPLLPWVFGPLPWSTEFQLEWGELTDQARDGGLAEPEDILDRLGQKLDEPPVAFAYPLPSAYGPYGLMRAAAATGGNYWLWSCNPRGRADLLYDWGRCNLFPPDLRSRSEILADVRRDPLLAALVGSWNRIAGARCPLAQLTPPVTAKGESVPMDYLRGGGGLCMTFRTRAERSMFLRRAALCLATAVETRAVLARALDGARPPDPARARYRADAELLRLVLDVFSFELSEAIAAAAGIPRNAWDDPGCCPALEAVVWVSPRLQPGDNPEEVLVAANVAVRHPREGAKVVEARRDHQRRYAGTPFGEIVSRNGVVTYRVTMVVSDDGRNRTPPSSGTPSESKPDGTKTPAPAGIRPPAGSSGGGPATGR